MKFTEIPNMIKAAIAIGVLAVSGFAYHDKFITKAEAAESERIAWIRDLKAEVRQLERLKKSQNGETAEDTQKDIEELKELIRCVQNADEDKVKFCG